MIYASHSRTVPKNPVAIPKGWKLLALALASWILVFGIIALAWSLLRSLAG